MIGLTTHGLGKLRQRSRAIVKLPEDSTEIVVSLGVPGNFGQCIAQGNLGASQIARMPQLEASVVFALSAVELKVV